MMEWIPRAQTCGYLMLVLRSTVTILILGYLLSILDWSIILNSLQRLRWTYFALGTATVAGGLLFAVSRWRILLRHFDVDISVKEGMRYYLKGAFYSIVLPGIIGGDAVRITMCAVQKAAAWVDVLVTVLVERGLGIVFLLVVGGCGVILLDDSLAARVDEDIRHLILCAAILAVVLCGIGIVILKAVPQPNGECWNTGVLSKFIQPAWRLKRVPVPVFFLVFVLTGLFQLADIGAAMFVAQAVHIELPYQAFLIIIPIVYIVTVLPISLGGLGVREGVTAYLLSSFGIPAPEAVIFAFVLYLNRVVLAIGGAAAEVIGSGVMAKQILWNKGTRT